MINDKILNASIFNRVDKIYLKEFLKDAQTKNYSSNDFIVHENDISNGMYVILEGELKVLLSTKQSEDSDVKMYKQIAQLGPGDIFGEISLLSDLRRTASIQAMTDVTTLYIDSGTFNKRIDKNELNALRIAYNISKIMAARFKDVDAMLEQISSETSSLAKDNEILALRDKFLMEAYL